MKSQLSSKLAFCRSTPYYIFLANVRGWDVLDNEIIDSFSKISNTGELPDYLEKFISMCYKSDQIRQSEFKKVTTQLTAADISQIFIKCLS